MRARADIADVPSVLAEALVQSESAPFIVPHEVAEHVPEAYWLLDRFGDVLICPLRWEHEQVGALIAIGPAGTEPFDDAAIRLARGVGDLTALALGNARRISELERFHRLVESLDAIFWEADADDLDLTFLGGRLDVLFADDEARWHGRVWGDHIADADRSLALAEVRRAIAEGTDVSVEYRVRTSAGDTLWLRDLVHVVHGRQGARQIRGLIIDITERKQAEQTLRESERKYSEAFLREREAAQQLRALDAMKNTFLEAVSHDLRTPLTSILGSALTLEQSRLQMPPADALDLVHRIAANARKLERLLGDLLDLDRLQRGIVTPQRRPTDVAALIAGVVAEVENPDARMIDTEVGALTAPIDGPKVERIVENLIANAIRHTPPEAHIRVWTTEQDDGIVIGVDDAGPGIPVGARESIFEPFEQTAGPATEHSPGVGIGLSLVRRFAELHGGRAWVEPRDGGGSSFRVFLPNA
jgi:PAS domain S-box-containing protein